MINFVSLTFFCVCVFRNLALLDIEFGALYTLSQVLTTHPQLWGSDVSWHSHSHYANPTGLYRMCLKPCTGWKECRQPMLATLLVCPLSHSKHPSLCCTGCTSDTSRPYTFGVFEGNCSNIKWKEEMHCLSEFEVGRCVLWLQLHWQINGIHLFTVQMPDAEKMKMKDPSPSLWHEQAQWGQGKRSDSANCC